MQRTLDVGQQEIDGVTIVTLGGIIDADSVHAFSNALEPLCGRRGARLVLDCGHLEYINSRSLGLLNKYHSQCERNGGRMAFARIPKKIADILKLLGLASALTIRDSVREAVEAVK